MDILIKNNVIKKNKFVVDIGMYATKILQVHYAAKKAEVLDAKSILYKGMTDDGKFNFTDLAKKIDAEISGQGRNDVAVSLPAELCECKIITIKNRKESEIPKIIKKDYSTFGRANPVTHVVDFSFIGKREEDGDTVYYYFLSAVHKSIAADLIAAFSKYKLRVKTIVSSTYNQICLSELYFDEYEHLNRLFVDFGTNTTRITAFSEGMAVYTRTIELGFNSYARSLFDVQEKAGKPEIIRVLTNVGEYTDLSDNLIGAYFRELDKDMYRKCLDEVDNYIIGDISRVIDLCENNDFAVSKIYYTGYVLKGFEKKLTDRLNIEMQQIAFSSYDKKVCKGYILEIEDAQLDEGYSNALGLCISPYI